MINDFIMGYGDEGACKVWGTNQDTAKVCERHNIPLQQVVNLCGGVPAANILTMKVEIRSVSENAIKVSIVTKLYSVERRIDFKNRIIVNLLMHVFKEDAHTGTALFLNQVKYARKMGFSELRTQAQGREIPTGVDGVYWDGYYRWARLGYQMEDPDELNRLRELLEDEGYPMDTNFGDLVLSDKGYQLWKHKGFTWSGVFYLEDGSPSMTHLHKYLAKKKITFSP